MANKLEITSQYRDASWVVTSKVEDSSDSDFPRDIFLWTLNDVGQLDCFQAIGHADQVAKYKLYDSNRTNNFGIRLVRYSNSEQSYKTEAEMDKAIVVLKSAFQILLDGYDVASEPVIETYPEY